VGKRGVPSSGVVAADIVSRSNYDLFFVFFSGSSIATSVRHIPSATGKRHNGNQNNNTWENGPEFRA
jgi:hypothetical protein